MGRKLERFGRPYEEPDDKLWADFYEWPERWKGFDKDVPYGEGIIAIYKPFVKEITHGLSD
jgi:hypothetical protein